MKKFTLYIFLFLFVYNAYAQFYFRGEVKDEKNLPLPKVQIQLKKNNGVYYSASTGYFSIPINNTKDSVSFLLEGYEPQTIKLTSNEWVVIILKIASYDNNRNKPKLISVTKDMEIASKTAKIFNDETYFQLVENESIDARKFPNTNISLNINKASYSNIRRFINAKSPVPPDAVRIEELHNYFNLNYNEPQNDETFKIQSQLTSCPWDNNKQVFYISINARKLNLEKTPPSNFVFLIDVSGSMDMPNRLPLLQAAFQLFVKNLRPVDTVSMVTYGGGVGISLTPTSGDQKEKILQAVEELSAYGSTPGEAAIITAYKLAQSVFKKDGNNRIILATDGDFNVGQNSEKSLEQLITQMRQTGIYLTCLGVGMGNFKDSKLEILAKKGNGNFAYLDDLKEAEKVLVKELTQNFYTVADNGFMNIEFNSQAVKEYRLIGFDNKKDALLEKVNEIEGGEIGGGSSILAMFEIVLHKKFSDAKDSSEVVANATLQYTIDSPQVKRFICRKNYIPFNLLNKDLQFAAALAMFGLKIKFSSHAKNINWLDIESIAKQSVKPDNYLQDEFLELIEKSKKIYPDKKKRKRIKN